MQNFVRKSPSSRHLNTFYMLSSEKFSVFSRSLPKTALSHKKRQPELLQKFLIPHQRHSPAPPQDQNLPSTYETSRQSVVRIKEKGSNNARQKQSRHGLPHHKNINRPKSQSKDIGIGRSRFVSRSKHKRKYLIESRQLSQKQKHPTPIPTPKILETISSCSHLRTLRKQNETYKAKYKESLQQLQFLNKKLKVEKKLHHAEQAIYDLKIQKLQRQFHAQQNLYSDQYNKFNGRSQQSLEYVEADLFTIVDAVSSKSSQKENENEENLQINSKNGSEE